MKCVVSALRLAGVLMPHSAISRYSNGLNSRDRKNRFFFSIISNPALVTIQDRALSRQFSSLREEAYHKSVLINMGSKIHLAKLI